MVVSKATTTRVQTHYLVVFGETATPVETREHSLGEKNGHYNMYPDT